MEYDKGDLVWFDPGLGYVLPGEVIEFHRAGQVITVQALIGGKSQVFTLTNLSSVRRRQDLGVDGVQDMTNLGDLNEASLLWNLKIRYDKEYIYTFIGSILVAVNPYKMLDVYGLDMVKKYEGQILGTLPPHIFAIGSSAYARMSKDLKNQCVIISGESGSGKTESTKLIMQYLAAVNKSQSNLITEQILEASPLLESFGNAKTARNDNSSRYGKYLEIFFRGGVICGAKINEYLLEKSRVCSHPVGERNYHVFYELLAGLSKESKDKYGLTDANRYFFLSEGKDTSLTTKDDAEDFQALLSSMQVLGFTNEEQETIFKILAIILHLGNVYFHRKEEKGHGDETVAIGEGNEVKWIAHLLQVKSDMVRRCLTTKVTEKFGVCMDKGERATKTERIVSKLTIDQALDVRDAIAKGLYSALFTWLVSRVNNVINKDSRRTSIAILDIFGFEVFNENYFEQLCINYANEKLHNYFIKHIFKMEQQTYAKERIEWTPIEFQDNAPLLDMFNLKPVGIFHLLDDECNFPKASDQSFLGKCNYNHALNELYSRPRVNNESTLNRPQALNLEFGIKHYAGQVWYSLNGFLEKNRDSLRSEILELLISSKLPLVSGLFRDMKTSCDTRTLTKTNGRFGTVIPRTPTITARFKDSLGNLLDTMSKCNPWFIKCIKPNTDKSALKLDMPIVLEQLRYSGMLETIKVRQQGYPVRMKFNHFAQRYRCLVPGQVPRGAPSKEICRVVIGSEPFRNHRENYQLGTTKVFLRENLDRDLEHARYQKLSQSVVTLQKYVRGYLARKRHRTMRQSAVLIQSVVRMWQAKKRYQALRNATVKAQALMRGKISRKSFTRLKVEHAQRKRVEAVAKQRAKREAAQSKVEQERVQRSVAGVNHLEIPAELAFVLSTTSDWNSPHGERHVSRATNAPKPMHENYKLPSDLDYYGFTKFTNIYFKSHLWKMKREPIKTPFLAKTRDSDYTDSLAIFKLILRFMNDHTLSGTRESIHGNYIVNKGIKNEKMRDEILCQLSNQTWHNDNPVNAQRGWLLMANCLSAFPPSSVLHKYLLKYVSDHGYNGYAGLCQRKVLSSQKKSSGVPRNFPPTDLEWQTNKRKLRMALEAYFADGQSKLSEVDSWTNCSEFAANLLKEMGIANTSGWTVALNHDDSLTEATGMDYVLDLIAEKELPPRFPSSPSNFLKSGSNNPKSFDHGMSTQSVEDMDDFNTIKETPLVARMTRSPPPLTRKLSREALEAHDQVMGSDGSNVEGNGNGMGLSRTSALNNRYFDDKTKSRSLDNLLEPAMPNMQELVLSESRLNDRYHSIERLNAQRPNIFERRGSEDPSATSGALLRPNQNGSRNPMDMGNSGKGLAAARNWNKYDLSEDRGGDDISRVAGSGSGSSRYIKGGNAGRRAYPGSHSSRAHIEKGDYTKSSAMSDTSEAPSLASHVRRVRVPSQASDVDEFVDELFLPVLQSQSQLDEMSDVRSLAASLKGGARKNFEDVTVMEFDSDSIHDEEDWDDTIVLARTRQGSFRRQSMLYVLQDIELNGSLTELEDPNNLSKCIKGGGKGTADVDSSGHQIPLPTTTGIPMGGFFPGSPLTSGAPGSPPPFVPLTTMPLYSPGGVGMSGVLSNEGMANLDTSQLLNHSNIQRAYIQSAVAQNMQIQQHLFAQNQALQQLLAQGLPVSFQEPNQTELWSHEKVSSSDMHDSISSEHRRYSKQTMSPGSPPPPLLNTSLPAGLSFSQAMASSSPVHTGTKKKHSAGSSNEDYKTTSPRHESPASGPATSPRIIPGHIPPPPPMPGDMSAYMDQYKRAKTVRIGKWRWPPAADGSDPVNDSFMEFKMRKNSKKMSRQDSSPKNSKDESGTIEWEEFEVGGSGDDSPRVETQMEVTQRMYQQYQLQQQELFQQQHKHQIKKQQFMMTKGIKMEDDPHTAETIDVKVSGRPRARRDSWDNPVEENKSPGIGKLKISREMREKLEAVTSSHTTRTKDPPVKQVKKLEAHRKMMLQQQLEGDGWDNVDSVKRAPKSKGFSAPPPPPIAPPSMHINRRPSSPTQSVSSQESSRFNQQQTSRAIPQPRSPPAPVQPNLYRNNVDYRERRNSVSTLQTEKNDQIELEESSEFLPSVDRAPIIIDTEMEQRSLDALKTRLLPPPQGHHLTYNKVPWKLMVRKEIFTPGEVLSGEALHLVFCQIVQDVYAGLTIRIGSKQRIQMRKLLDSYGITPNNTFSPHHKSSVKKEIVELAKSWPIYFACIIPITGVRGRDRDVDFMAVSHSGIRLLHYEDNELVVVQYHSFKEIDDVETRRKGSMHLVLNGDFAVLLYTPRAKEVTDLIGRFLLLGGNGSRRLVRAETDYITRDSSLLSFRKGDIIRVHSPCEDKRWLKGSLEGRTGVFPVEHVSKISKSEAWIDKQKSGIDDGLLEHTNNIQNGMSNGMHNGDGALSYDSSAGGGSTVTWTQHQSSSPHPASSPQPTSSPRHNEDSGHSSSGEGIGSGGSSTAKPSDSDGKHSLLQFALRNFRVAIEQGMMSDGTIQTNTKKKKKSKDGSEWTWKEQVEMVKFTQSRITKPLLPLKNELWEPAVNVFTNIMMFMGDYQMPPEYDDYTCVYNILILCHNENALRDEFYCQIMKQTTNNKSSVPDSAQRGWRLFSILTCYFTCSDNLLPCLKKYLEDAAFDKRRAFHGTAYVCLSNLRKTLKYGGRKTVPYVEEITATTAGRTSKRLIYRLPGGTEKVINTKSTTVVQDILEEMCTMINVLSPSEQEEFSLYCIVEGETFTMPLQREEYVLDVTTELTRNNQVFFLIFFRSVHFYPLRLDNDLYIEVVFNQIAPDYIEGLLLVLPDNRLTPDSINDIARIAPLMHRAADLPSCPVMKEVKFLLPKPALTIPDMKPAQWVKMVQDNWPEISHLTPLQAKAQVLEILQRWPLFGSAFFMVQRVIEMSAVEDNILVLNKNGVHFLKTDTHETVHHYPLSQVMSARKGKTEDGLMYLDLKCGNLMQHRITRIKTENAFEIQRLIGSYIGMKQRFQGHKEEDLPDNTTLSRDGNNHGSPTGKEDPNYMRFKPKSFYTNT